MYDIPKSTLQTRLRGIPSRHEIRSVNLNLTDTEELTLVNWILSMDERDLPVRIPLIRDMANLLLQKRTCTVGLSGKPSILGNGLFWFLILSRNCCYS